MDREPTMVGVGARLLSPVIGAAALSIVLAFATSARSAPFVDVSLPAAAASMEFSGNLLGSNSQSPKLASRCWLGCAINVWSLGKSDFLTAMGGRIDGKRVHSYGHCHDGHFQRVPIAGFPLGPPQLDHFQPDRGPGNVIPTPELRAAACFSVGFLLIASQLRGRAKSRS